MNSLESSTLDYGKFSILNMTTMGSRLKTALDARGKDAVWLIAQIKSSKGTVYNILDDTTKPDKIRGATVAAICDALAIRGHWLQFADGPMETLAAKPISNGDDTPLKNPGHAVRRVQILGAVEMNEDGFWRDLKDVGVGFVQWHADETAYAVQLDTDYLQAKLARGTIVLFERVMPSADDLALVKLKDGRSTILIYQFDSAGRYAFTAIPDGRRVTFSLDEVEAIHAYAGIAPGRKRID